jgi:hypothetical protein
VMKEKVRICKNIVGNIVFHVGKIVDQAVV